MSGEKEDKDGSRKFQRKDAVAPVTLMVLFILVSISAALYLAPQYGALGYSDAFGERAENPLWAFAFLGMMIVVAIGILLLRKLLKRRKRNLKYVLAFAVFLATTSVLTPMLDLIVNGSPEGWEVYDVGTEGIEKAFPLDPNDPDQGIILMTNGSFQVLEKQIYALAGKSTIDGLDEVFDPHFRDDKWLVTAIENGRPHGWTIGIDGTVSSLGELPSVEGDLDFLGGQLEVDGDRIYTVGIYTNESKTLLAASPLGDTSNVTVFEFNNESIGPFIPVQGWTTLQDNYLISESGYHRYDLEWTDTGIQYLTYSSGFSRMVNTSWGICRGDQVIFFTRADHWDTGMTASDPPLNTPHLRLEPNIGIIEVDHELSQYSTNLIWNSNDDHLLEYFSGSTFYRYTADEKESEETSLTNAVMLQRSSEKSDLWIVEGENVWNGDLSFKERNQYYLGLISIALSMALIIALLKKPKWWLVDIGGLVMGAGVIAMMGISFPLIFTLLLLVLLAGYDAVAVYKTKHMISLADSVVEAKMPILLVFPMKWSYRYEDETNLMDPKRKRESLFMGLGDVIIPGLFIVSVYSFLSPVGGTRLFGFIYPPLGVALFTLAGMLLGYGILMRWVLKGKAHAGLPPLNGGSILGFLIGYLLLYGTIVFW